jgi:hypothetical protein
MIVKYDNNSSLDRVNQIDVARLNKSPNKANLFRPFLILMFSIAFAFLLISLSTDSVVAVSEIKTGEQKNNLASVKPNNTQSSGRVIWEQNIATASGVGRITENTAQGKLLGRRGALTDARRNLLILREKLLNDPKFSEKDIKKNNVSGRIAGTVIHSEKIRNNLYFLQVDIPLNKLLEGDIGIEQY